MVKKILQSKKIPKTTQMQPTNTAPDMVTNNTERIPRDCMPRTGVSENDATRWVSDPLDPHLVQQQLGKMKHQMMDLKQMVQMGLKKRMVEVAQQQGMRVGKFPVGGWSDLQQSWREDHSKENGKRVWMALFGTFDGKDGKKYLDDLEVHCLKRMGWVYEDNTSQGDSKKPRGFIQKMISQQKGEVVRQVLEPVQINEGITVGITRNKDEIKNGKKGWRRTPGKFEDCFYRVAQLKAPSTPEATEIEESSDSCNPIMDTLKKNLAVSQMKLKAGQVNCVFFCVFVDSLNVITLTFFVFVHLFLSLFFLCFVRKRPNTCNKGPR